MQPLEPHGNDELRARLGALLDPAPPAPLWQRIEHSQRRRQQRRWALRGVAAVALLVFAGLSWRAPLPGEALAPPPLASASTPALADLDRQLQQAYDRELDPRVIQRLWQQRARLAQAAQWQDSEENHDVAIIEL